MRIDFRAAFSMVNHQGILCKLCSAGIRDSVLSILRKFLSNRFYQTDQIDASGVPKGMFWHIVVPPAHLVALFHTENKFIG